MTPCNFFEDCMKELERMSVYIDRTHKPMNMRKQNTPVEMMQGIQSTQTKNYYWVNHISPRLGLMSSTPYDSLADAEKAVSERVSALGKCKADWCQFRQIG